MIELNLSLNTLKIIVNILVYVMSVVVSLRISKNIRKKGSKRQIVLLFCGALIVGAVQETVPYALIENGWIEVSYRGVYTLLFITGILAFSAITCLFTGAFLVFENWGKGVIVVLWIFFNEFILPPVASYLIIFLISLSRLWIKNR